MPHVTTGVAASDVIRRLLRSVSPQLLYRKRALVAQGTRALVEAGYPAYLVERATKEASRLQPLVLQVGARLEVAEHGGRHVSSDLQT